VLEAERTGNPDQPGTPLVSVIMANFEAGGRIVHALRSVLAQTLGDIEVIVSDDASRDDSIAYVRDAMRNDGRVRLVTTQSNGGPARSRNRALEVARGRWIAVVDSDDIIHPERFERLLAAAAYHDADIVADDLLLFYEDGTAPRLMLGEEASTNFLVDTERWIMGGIGNTPALGYLKPLVRAEKLGHVRYDETLRIGEDYDLVLRLLLEGAAMVVVPEPFYLYRRHTASISHRLSAADVEAMIDRQAVVAAAVDGPLSVPVAAAFTARQDALRQRLAYEQLVASVKSRSLARAMSLIARDPTHLGRLWASFTEGRRRRLPTQMPSQSPVLFLGGVDAGSIAEVVPDYVPTEQVDWSAPRQRKIWRSLAARRGAGTTRCVPLDRAGYYATGFIPEAEITPMETAGRVP